jgi:hypothetical protein
MADENKGNPQSTPLTPEAIQAAISTLQALANAPKQQADTAAKEKAEAVERASKVDGLDTQIKALQEKKKVECVALLPLLHKHFGGRIMLANGAEVLAALSSEKRPTKKGLVAFLTEKLKDQGSALAAEFWKKIPSKPREYVTVRRPGETPVVGESEGPTEE